MRARLWKVGRGLLWFLSLPFRLLFWPFWQIALVGGKALRWLGRQSWAGLKAAGLFLWELWQPIHEILAYYLLGPLKGVWQGLGRMGLAMRRLLVAFVWQPLVWITAPFRWLGRQLWRLLVAVVRGLWRGAGWLGIQLRRLLQWLFRQLVQRPILFGWGVLVRRWRAGERGRVLFYRRLHSTWLIWRSRLWLKLRRPKPSGKAILIPAMPRPEKPTPAMQPARLVATLVAINLLILAVTLLSNHFNSQPNNAAPVGLSHITAVPPTATPEIISTVAAETPDALPEPDMLTAANRNKPTMTPWPLPDPLNPGGTIVFSQRQNGQSDLYALTIGDPTLFRLTNDAGDDRDPAWSPDGRRVAFASNRGNNWDIYVLDLQEGFLLRLTDHAAFDGGPAWSPDGQYIVFESYRTGNLDLFIIKADGSGQPIRLTEHPAPDFSPVWSPGGRHIAFTSWRSGNKDIYLISLDAVSDDTAVNLTNSPDRHEDHAAFSAAGDFVSFDEDSPGFDRILALPLQNYRPAGEPITVGQGKQAVWSPRGRDILYVHQPAQESFLLAGSVGGFGISTQAYAHNGLLSHPDWSPIILAQHWAESDYLQTIAQTADAPLFLEAVAAPAADAPPHLLYELPINAPSPFLSDRVDQSFLALRQRVQQEAGWDFLGQLDDMFHPINATALPGLNDRSWNKAGRAFSVRYAYSLSFDPQIEVLRQDVGVQVYWQVYLKTIAQDGTMGEPLRDLPWDFRARYGADPQYYDQGGVYKDLIPAGYYLDFTTTAADFGWTRVPAAENWRAYFHGIRFWHFENQQGLNWEQAMLELYTAEEILAVFR